MTPQERFGANLRRSRKQAGLTQEALWDSSGVNMTEISRIENGQKDPQLTTIVRLAVGLGIPPGDLLMGTDEALSTA
ncbi:MAG: helix-turn-helix domain-containing protein [Solirubrobacteraceae bacterium]